MLSQLVPIAHLYAVGDRMLSGIVGDFQDADWAVTDSTGHDARWIVGHIASIRERSEGLMGLPPVASPWHAQVARGTSPQAMESQISGASLVAAFHASQQRISTRWEELTTTDYEKPLGRTLPDGSATVGAALGFFAWHEAYHLGQLGLLRRLAGKPGRF